MKSTVYLALILILCSCGGGEPTQSSIGELSFPTPPPFVLPTSRSSDDACTGTLIDDYAALQKKLGAPAISVPVARAVIQDFAAKYKGVKCRARITTLQDPIGQEGMFDADQSLSEMTARVDSEEQRMKKFCTPAFLDGLNDVKGTVVHFFKVRNAENLLIARDKAREFFKKFAGVQCDGTLFDPETGKRTPKTFYADKEKAEVDKVFQGLPDRCDGNLAREFFALEKRVSEGFSSLAQVRPLINLLRAWNAKYPGQDCIALKSPPRDYYRIKTDEIFKGLIEDLEKVLKKVKDPLPPSLNEMTAFR